MCKIKKSCIIYVVAAVALQAQFGACEELLPSGPGHPLLALKGQFTLSCGLVGTCQSLTGAFFAIGAIFIVVKYRGDGLIGGVLQNYHARSKEIML